jgi:DNA-binding CsgD family transcriptional regulator/tetratricopeptide (TPR) repeat protein
MNVALSSPVLVGRDDLLALASRRLAAAAEGGGELLFLAGEAGIGKTRLLGEVVRRARAMGFTVVTAAASPGDAEVAAGLLGDLAGELGREPGTAEVGSRIAARLGAGGGDGDSDRQRRLLVGDVSDLLESLGADRTLIALEDLHWADDVTLDVLGRLGRRTGALKLLVVGTYRSDELYPRVPMRAWRTRLLTQRQAEEVRLGRLNREDTAALSAAITGAALPGTVAEEIYARSDGIPLHVEEFVAAVGGMPDTLADAVLGRAEQLSGDARRLAEVASVLGRSFDLDLLTAITGEGPAAVDDGLRELTERFFVQPRSDRVRYDFRHALIRDALYADLTPHRRRYLHARAAAAAVAAGFSPVFVSDQFERAAMPAEAFEYASAAARRAAEMSAHREAAELYRRAFRNAPADLSPALRATLLTEMADELLPTDQNAEASDCYAEAYRLHQEVNNPIAAAALVPDWVAVRHLLGADLAERAGALRGALPLIAFRDDSKAQEVRANIHAALSAAYMLDRRLSEAIVDGEFAQSIAVEDCDRAMRCNIDATLGSVFLFSGRIAEGLELLEGSISRAAGWRFEGQTARGYRMIGSSTSMLVEYPTALRWLGEGIAYAERVEQFSDRHYMAAHLAHVHWAVGDWDRALSLARQALADGGGITTRITALHVLGFVAFGRGEFDSASALLTEAASLGEGMRELQRLSPAWWGLAETALLSGSPSEAVAWCEKGFEASARVRDAAYLFPYLVTGVRAYLGTSGATAAREWLSRTAAIVTDRGIPGTLGAIGHGWGLIHLHEGQTGRARTELEAAEAFWRGRRRFWEGAAARVDRARCSSRGSVALLLASARNEYASVGALFPVPALSGSLSGSLSAREMEVARLVAAGMTNREIAAALTIALKTAAAHVEHIRTKLGFSRRSQIAAWVVAQG